MENEQDISRRFSIGRILIPVLLGLVAASYLLYNNLTAVRFEKAEKGKCGDYAWVDANHNGRVDATDAAEFKKVDNCQGTYRQMSYKDVLARVNWTWNSTFWLFLAVMGMVVRDVAYIYRIRELTDRFLSWKQSFKVIMLWEFASALTPSVVGGSGVAVFILNREKISLGRSTAIVMVTAMLDEIFYITMVALVLICLGTSNLFPVQLEAHFLGMTFGTQGIFWVGYIFIIAMTTVILIGVIFKPRATKYTLLQLFRIPFLKRWRYRIIAIGNDIMVTSEELKGKPLGYWLRPTIATYISWIGRYAVVNLLIMAFAYTNQHLLIYARQLVMWVIMLISPTPGSSGVAEIAFSGFLKEFIPLGLSGALAILWRLISYYPYLFIGAIILPKWLRETAPEKKPSNQPV